MVHLKVRNMTFAKYSEIDFGKTPRATADDILNVLLVEGKVVKIAEDMYTLTEYMEEAKNIIREKLAEDPVITIAQVRDILRPAERVRNQFWNIWTVSFVVCYPLKGLTYV